MVQKLYGFKLTVTMVMISAYTIYSRNSTITTTKSSSYESKELDIYGNVVVWIESDNVYMYDIVTHKITQVTNSGNADEPAIYGNRIVYKYGSHASFRGDTYMYEISTAKKLV
jgi:hypothetical protein